MTSAYVYTPDIWPALAAAIFLAALGLYGWRRRGVPGALPLAAGSLFGALWMLGMALEAASVAPATKIAWHKFQAVLQLPAVTAMTCFALEYVNPGRWLTRRNLRLLSLPPLLLLLFIVTNDSQLMWRQLEIGADGAVVPYYATPGAILVAYGLSLVLVNTAAFLWLFIRSPQHRWPVALLLFGQIAGRGLYLFDVANVPLLRVLDPVVAAFLLVWTVYAIALFGFHIFDPLPTARGTVIEQMQEGMLVFDARWHVASLNPAAAAMLSTSAARARGKTLAEVVPAFPDLSARLADAAAGATEISLGTGPEARCYALDMSLLKDFRGLPAGHLILLRDVTERRQAEAALRESQEKQRLIFENAFDGIAIYEEHPDTGERRILDCNERYAQMSGRSRKELLEIGDTALVQKPIAPVPYAKPRQEIEAAQSEGFFSWVRPDGRENIIEYSAASIRADGRLLTIGLDRDVTERKQAEAQILEQQRTLATLHERERLARELHDSLGQVFAFVHTQGQTVRRLLARGDIAGADDHVARLVEVTREADTDIRESILALRVTLAEQGLFPALATYLHQYELRYGIHTELSKPETLGEEAFGPLVEVQLLRIIQEALTNARKHAHARSVGVTFAVHDGCAQVTVRDDGRGFDSQAVFSDSGGRVGLRVMRERAEEVGGGFAVLSRLDEGTQVIVTVPLRAEGGVPVAEGEVYARSIS